MTNNNAIVGYTGFVGSNLLQFYEFKYMYNSKTFINAKYKTFDTVFFCGIPAMKWKANKYPEEDNIIFEEIISILDTITVNKIILISTIDVYDNINGGLNEDYHQSIVNHTYGKNRLLFEEYIINRYENHHIVRLPALFGKGLKKNMIYDLIHNNNVSNIQINSSFQWYCLDWLKNDIDIIISNNIPICNLFTEPVHTSDIIKTFHRIYGIDYEFMINYLANNDTTISYNTCTKYNTLFDSNKPYIRNSDKIIEALTEYLKFEKLDKTLLCVSNICVNKVSQLQFACILKLYGITKVQIAPTKLINIWEELPNMNTDIFNDNNLDIYSLQSIVYGLNHLNIFDANTSEKLYNHLINIIDYVVNNKISTIVFGCPRNRKVLDTNIDNKSIFVSFFKRIGTYCQGKDIIICLENNSKQYNCNFINTIDECANIVMEVDSPNIKMMVDLGNAVMENDQWHYLNKYKDIIYNIDISQEHMKDFTNIHESNTLFKNVIDNINYNKVINLEMLIKDDDELPILRKSLTNFISTYI
jgi:sugar phosphate isomerase/epimerase